MMPKRSENAFDAATAVAGNSLIDRRALLGRGVVFAGATGIGAMRDQVLVVGSYASAELTTMLLSKPPNT